MLPGHQWRQDGRVYGRGIVLLAFLLLLPVYPGLAADPSQSLAPLLTDQELRWLKAHPTIRLAHDGYFPPYSFRNEAGIHEGFVVDFFDLLAEHTGLDFEIFEQDKWKELYSAAQERRLDAVSMMVDRPERREWFNFTDPYIYKSLVIMTRADDERIHQRQNLAGKTVALVKDYQYSARVIREFPSVQPKYFETMVDALNAVSTHQADAAISFLGGGHYLRARHMMTNLKFAAIYDRNSSFESIAIRKDWPELASILNKALGTITEGERLAIERQWLPQVEFLESHPVRLTEAENRWVADHPVIRMGVDPEFRPFEYLDEEGVHRGIAADYVRLLTERTGLNLEVVPNLSWEEVMERAQHREVDVLPAVGITRDRQSFLIFSEGYAFFHRVIITRTELPFLTGVSDLEKLRVAVQADSSHAGFLAEYPEIEVEAYQSLQSAIFAVAEGQADALVGNLASASYWIRELNVTNLKVAGATSENAHGLHFAVRKDWPILSGILQKGLASITEAEREEIASRWVVLTYTPKTNYGPIIRIVCGALVLLLVALLWVLRSRRQQKRLLKAQHQAKIAQQEAENANLELVQMHENLENLVKERTCELEESEKRFRQAQKMEALGSLVGGIAHDFNNVLTGLLGSIYLARSHSDHPDSVRTYLSTGEKLAEHGSDMIKQLLAFARQESVTKEPITLGSFLVEAERLIKTAVPSNIDLNIGECPPDLFVHGNAALLEQVLFNIVINARDSLEGSEAPRIDVTVDRKLPTVQSRERYPGLNTEPMLCIGVRDNGTGIPPQELDRLFDPFFTTKAPGKGTGLGLAMAYGTIRDHGGIIEVQSELGVGSLFCVLLPLIPQPKGLVPEVNSEIYRGRGESILLADDHKTLLNLQKASLVDLGYRVTAVRDGQEALDHVALNPGQFDLVLLDNIMPRMTGMTAAREIRRINPTIKVVFLTGYNAKESDPEHPDPDHEIVLRKPCSVPVLSQVLREQLGDSRTQSKKHQRQPLGPKQETLQPRGQSPKHQKETILLCDDDELIRRMMVRFLEGAGYTVLVASDGPHALQLAEAYSKPIHLLLTDVSMPGMNGLETAAALQPANPELRTLFLSGLGEDLVVSASGGDSIEFLNKPFSGKVLLRRVREVLD